MSIVLRKKVNETFHKCSSKPRRKRIMIKELIDYEKASGLVKQHPEMQHFVGPRDESLIASAENILTCTFPASYRRFLSEYGAGSFGASEIYGVIHEDFFNSAVPDAVWCTLDERELGLPENLIVIYNDGTGFLNCIDCSRGEQGDYPVVGFYGGFPLEMQPFESLFPNFGSFFFDIVQLALSSKER